MIPRTPDQVGRIRFAGVEEWEAQLSEAFRQLHALNKSLVELRLSYERTGDERFRQGAKPLLVYYRTWLEKYKQASAALGKAEAPAAFMATLADFSEWSTAKVIKPLVEETAAGLAKTAGALPQLLTLALIAAGILGAAWLVTTIAPRGAK